PRSRRHAPPGNAPEERRPSAVRGIRPRRHRPHRLPRWPPERSPPDPRGSRPAAEAHTRHFSARRLQLATAAAGFSPANRAVWEGAGESGDTRADGRRGRGALSWPRLSDAAEMSHLDLREVCRQDGGLSREHRLRKPDRFGAPRVAYSTCSYLWQLLDNQIGGSICRWSSAFSGS